MTVKTYPTGYLWRHYWNVFGTLTHNGTPSDADCAIALAFGRNTLSDRELPIVRRDHDNILDKAHADDIHIRQLDHKGFNPGSPNGHIAEAVYMSIHEYNLAVAAQWEVVVAVFLECGPSWVAWALDTQKLICLWPHPEQTTYPSHEVLDDALSYLPSQSFIHPLLIAHDLHMPRVYMLAAKRWQCPVVGYQTITRAFDQGAVQAQASKSSRRYRYEALCRIHHFYHRWV